MLKPATEEPGILPGRTGGPARVCGTCGSLGVFILVAALAGLPTSPIAALTVTEIHYHPGADSDGLEFIEIHNELTDPVDITGYFLRGVDFVFEQRTFLAPGAYIVVCANASRVRSVYGIDNVVGDWDADTALSNRGEAIELLDPAGIVECRVRYEDRGDWPAGADGTGHTLELIDVYTDATRPSSWTLSPTRGGTPGHPYLADADAIAVRFNEALLRGAGERWIELYNDAATPADLSGHHIATDRNTPTTATLQPGTVLAPGGFLLLDETTLGISLAPEDEGELLAILSSPGGERVIDAHVFAPRFDGASEARVPDGKGPFSPAAEATPGRPNRVVPAGDVVINEILYHSLDNHPAGEFVELYNRAGAAVDLSGWAFTDGIRYTFPQGLSLPGGEHLVVAREPAFVRELYQLPTWQVVGPETEEDGRRFGKLANDGERLTLKDARGNIVDTLHYEDGGEWPRWADGGGSSLERIDPAHEGAVGQAWDASDESGKAETTSFSYEGSFQGPDGHGAELHIVLEDPGIVILDNIEIREHVEVLEDSRRRIAAGDVWRFFKGRSAPSTPPGLWREPTFDDSAWLEGATIIGVGSGDESTVLDDLFRNYLSVFFRKDFDVAPEDVDDDLLLTVEYDDGFAAYINGIEVATEDLQAGERAFDSRATSQNERVVTVQIPGSSGVLRPGRNVLAVQVHNGLLSSADFRFGAQLHSGRLTSARSENLLADGDFELTGGDSSPWPASASNPSWRMEGTHVRSGRTTVNSLDGAGSLKLIATGGGDNRVNRVETTEEGLTSPQVHSTVEVSFDARWVVGSPVVLTHGAYLGSDSPSYARSHRLPVPSDPGTPGTTNSVTLRRARSRGSANLGPVISALEQSPAVPLPDREVVVRARVEDPDGVASAMLHYSLERPLPSGHPELRSVPLQLTAQDNIHEARIPGHTRGERIVYFLTATDREGNTGRYPLDHLNRTHPLVLDASTASPADARHFVYRHESAESRVSEHLSHRFWLHQVNEEYLATRATLSNDPVESTLVFDDRVLYPGTRIRLAGSPFARAAPWEGSYRVRLPEDRPLHGRWKKFNLENRQGRGGKDARERAAHYLLRHNQGATRVPYTLPWIVEMHLNDQVVGTFKERVEVPSREFLSRWYPGDAQGAFFEMNNRHNINDLGTRVESRDARLLYPPYNDPSLGEDREEYRYYFTPRGRNVEDDFSELIALAKFMTPGSISDEVFDAGIGERIDVEQFLRVWAVRLNTDDADSWGASRGKNCYLYRPSDGRWVLIPWDMELTFDPGNLRSYLPPVLSADDDPLYANVFPEVERLLNRPWIKRIFYGVVAELVAEDGPFHPKFLTPYMEELDAIGLRGTELGKPGGFVELRRELLLEAVRGVSSSSIDFSITTAGGEDFSTAEPELLLEGVAPVEIRSVVVLAEGEREPGRFTASFSRSSIVRWSARGHLVDGRNALTCLGLDPLGNVVTSARIQVTLRANTSSFVRGDADGSGHFSIIDVLAILEHLGGADRLPCFDAADLDDNGRINIADAVQAARFIFRDGRPPAAPYPEAGIDPTGDGLRCDG